MRGGAAEECRIEQIVAQLDKAGIQCPEGVVKSEPFDPKYVDRMVD